MKKLVGIFSGFLGGLALCFLVLVNPFGIDSFHWIQGRLGIPHPAPVSAPAGGQLWTCGMHPEVIRTEPGKCPICHMDLTPLEGSGSAGEASGEKEILYWRAPMDPNYVSDKPGKSPMGMDLIPVYRGDLSPAAGVVQLDVGYLQTFGVRSQPAIRGDLPIEIRSVGTVRYDDERMSLVTTKYEGWVEEARVNLVGERVEKGQELFRLYSPKLVAAQQEYLQALRYAGELAGSEYPEVASRAEALVAAAAQRLSYWDVSAEQVRRLKERGEVLRTLPVIAPASGVVVEKMSAALEGMFVRPGMNLYRIVPSSPVLVDADLFEGQLGAIGAGQAVMIRLPQDPTRTFAGRVRLISPDFSSATRTLKVLVEVSNPGEVLRADMYVDVLFSSPGVSQAVLIPEESVIHSGMRELVVIDRGSGLFQVVEVTLGAVGQGRVEVLKGIEEGDPVVVSSQFLIDSESNLREAIRRVTGGS